MPIEQYEIAIKEFLKLHEEFDLNAIERTAFISLALSVCRIVDECITNNGVGFDGIYPEVVMKTYGDIYLPIVKTLIDGQEEIRKALEEQIKYGTKITLTTEQMENFKKEVEDLKWRS